MTPCMSPLSQDGPLLDKGSPSLGLIQEETEVINSIMGNEVPILLSVLPVYLKVLLKLQVLVKEAAPD